METNGLVKQEFITLRDEIRATRYRLFWIVAMALFGVPILTYVASTAAAFVMLLVPFSVLALIIVFLSEQNVMMRAGRYIRERIEADPEQKLGWEAWLESRSELRLMEKHFVACLVIILFVYYALTIGMAVQRLSRDAADDPSGQYWYWLIGAAAIYGVGAIWAVSTLVHHWKSSVSTTTQQS
jgi:hypothetical protein